MMYRYRLQQRRGVKAGDLIVVPDLKAIPVDPPRLVLLPTLIPGAEG
jgi:hypothetical protein